MKSISIQKYSAHGLKVLIDGQDSFKQIPYEVRLELWRKSIETLEEDVVNTAHNFKDEPFGEFIWCLTWENHRNDGLAGTIYFYYLISIINWLIEKNSIKAIKIDTDIPHSLHFILSNLFPTYIQKPTGASKNFSIIQIKLFFACLKKIMILLNPSFFFKSKQTISLPKNSILLQVKDDFKKNRYGLVLQNLNLEECVIFHKDIWRKPKSHPFGNRVIDFSNYISFELITTAFKNARKVQKLKQLYKNYFDTNLFVKSVYEELFCQTFLTQIKYLVFDRMLDSLAPKMVLTVTSITDPVSRLPETVAGRKKIPTIVVACRSMISSLRAEDRVAFPDLHNFNATNKGDYFIVRDLYSKNTWLSQGISDQQIIIASNDALDNMTKSAIKIIENGIILLLTQFNNNQQVFESLSKLKTKKLKKIYLRSHPNRRKVNEVSIEQKELLINAGFEIEDITDILMSDIKCIDSIALTPNSTSGVEVVKTGASIIWLPYISEHSIQFADIMECLGKTFYNETAFLEYINVLDNSDIELKRFVDDCHKQNETLFVSKHKYDIQEFLEKIQNG